MVSGIKQYDATRNGDVVNGQTTVLAANNRATFHLVL